MKIYVALLSLWISSVSLSYPIVSSSHINQVREENIYAFIDEASSLEELKELAYKKFSGGTFASRPPSLQQTLLKILTYTKHEVNGKLFKKVFAKTYDEFVEFSKNTQTKNIQTYTSFPVLENSDEEIEISHGGGKRYLEAFLSGENKGYAAEANGYGIFVTTDPYMQIRDADYATRTPLAHFDNPVTMKAKIAKKYLHIVNTNRYEAVILSEHVKHLKDIRIQDVSIDHYEIVKQTLPSIPFYLSPDEIQGYFTSQLLGKNYSTREIAQLLSYLLPLYGIQ